MIPSSKDHKIHESVIIARKEGKGNFGRRFIRFCRFLTFRRKSPISAGRNDRLKQGKINEYNMKYWQ